MLCRWIFRRKRGILTASEVESGERFAELGQTARGVPGAGERVCISRGNILFETEEKHLRRTA